VQNTRYYFGTYEKTIKSDNSVEEIDYIYTPSGLTYLKRTTSSLSGRSEEGLYVHTDHLGSIQAITNAAKAVVSYYAYTPWGGRILLSGANITDRGYTGHEHLEAFGLINMNGRVYDPVLARFLSPDPYVSDPGSTQGFNRYSYCLNNPFKYTDPSGEFVWNIVIGAVVGGVVNWATHGAQLNWKGLGYFGVGAVAGAIAGASGNIFEGSGFLVGFANGTISGAASGFISGTGNSWMAGDGFSNGLNNGLKSAVTGAIVGGMIGGTVSGIDAVIHDGNFLTGVNATYEQVISSNTDGQTIWSEKDYQRYRLENGEKDDIALRKRFMKLYHIKEGDFGIEKISTDKLYSYRITTDGFYVNEKGELVSGVTRVTSFGHTTIRISLGVTQNNNDIVFKYTAGHELIHAFHRFNYTTDQFNKTMSERAAYDYSDMIALKYGGLNTWLKSLSSRPTEFYGSSSYRLTTEQLQHLLFTGL